MTSHADRIRRSRERQASGRILIPVEFDEVELTDALVRAGWLSPLAADDPEAVRMALQAAEIEIRPRTGHAS